MEQLTIFSVYAPEDKLLYDALEKHLHSLQREYRLNICSPDTIRAGQNRTVEIDRFFNHACIILLLISPDFVRSDYSNAIEEHIRTRQSIAHLQHTIPILLRPVDWKYTAISCHQALPGNNVPVTSWSHQDEAFLNIATGIRRVVETVQSPTHPSPPTVIPATNPPKLMNQIATGIRHVVSKIQSPTAVSAISATEPPELQIDTVQQEVSIKHYIYISDAKVNSLAQQIGWKKEDILPFHQRYQALHTTLRQLERAKQIWSLKSSRNFKTGDYITGTCPMRWGTIKWESKISCFFFAKLPSRIVLMAGSAYHLKENEQSSKELYLGISGSSLPGIISAIDFAIENNNVEWAKGVGGISHYLFALAFVQDKLFNELKIKRLATPFEEQMLEFTALVHKTLSLPSAQDIRSFFQSNVISKKDQQEINQMLSKASEILICSPVYVSLGRE